MKRENARRVWWGGDRRAFIGVHSIKQLWFWGWAPSSRALRCLTGKLPSDKKQLIEELERMATISVVVT